MSKNLTKKLSNVDFNFEHSLVKVIANRNCSEIKLAGLNVGPFEEGNEYEIQFWIAEELKKAGIVRFRGEESLDANKIYKIHWTERIQATSQISKLPENFYPKVRRYLTELRNETAKNPEKIREHEKILHSVRDIVNLRLKKIVSLASAPAQTEQFLRNLTEEERLLYDQLYKLIQEWKTKLLEFREGKDK
jgi:hypothetical protein